MYRILLSCEQVRSINSLSFVSVSLFRPDERRLQEVLPAGSLQEDRRRRSYFAKWEGPRLRHYFPDSQHPPAVYAPIRSAAVRLQRPSLHLRWRARGRQLQGKSQLWNLHICVYVCRRILSRAESAWFYGLCGELSWRPLR